MAVINSFVFTTSVCNLKFDKFITRNYFFVCNDLIEVSPLLNFKTCNVYFVISIVYFFFLYEISCDVIYIYKGMPAVFGKYVFNFYTVGEWVWVVGGLVTSAYLSLLLNKPCCYTIAAFEAG